MLKDMTENIIESEINNGWTLDQMLVKMCIMQFKSCRTYNSFTNETGKLLTFDICQHLDDYFGYLDILADFSKLNYHYEQIEFY